MRKKDKFIKWFDIVLQQIMQWEMDTFCSPMYVKHMFCFTI